MLRGTVGRVAACVATAGAGGALMGVYVEEEVRALKDSQMRVARYLDQELYSWAAEEQERYCRRHDGLTRGIPFTVLQKVARWDVLGSGSLWGLWGKNVSSLVAWRLQAVQPQPLYEYSLLEHARPTLLNFHSTDQLQQQYASLAAAEAHLTPWKAKAFQHAAYARRRCLVRAMDRTRNLLLRRLAFETLYHKQLPQHHAVYRMVSWPQEALARCWPQCDASVILAPALHTERQPRQCAPQALCALLLDTARRPPIEWTTTHLALLTLALAACVSVTDPDKHPEALCLLKELYKRCEQGAWAHTKDIEEEQEHEERESCAALVLWAMAAAAGVLRLEHTPAFDAQVQTWAHAFTVAQRDPAWPAVGGECIVGSTIALLKLLPRHIAADWQAAARRYWQATTSQTWEVAENQHCVAQEEAIAFAGTDGRPACALPELEHACAQLRQQLPRCASSNDPPVFRGPAPAPLPLL